ncbi:hypothetical protein [Paenibacillus sp. LHD-38]|uniref:hypothetical protein n=1 Tax=Paenibacillus sp. LHD-38 TaxID=3072143 RepID=UPI00280E076A|nr:hypothetical protein [Paenibacillus sp. LHD-38]MDQ8734998.1 hypothetical protein [Paenibacillus sp. LHD-38]
MKKWLITTLALMLTFGVLSACGSANNEGTANESNGNKNAAEDKAEDVTLAAKVASEGPAAET